MVSSSRKMWLSCAVSLCVVAVATAAGNNGYSYDAPAIPFPPQTNANNIPTPPAYRPPRPTQPAPRPNTYIPPQPTPEMWLSCAVSLCVVAVATAAGNNGYSYDAPAIPFPPQTNANNIPTPPAYRPSRPTQPAPRPNTYIPPQPTPEHHDHHEHHEDHHHHEPGMPFDFSYAVNEDDNNYSHNAISDGDVTRGEYRVALPDGRTQIVKYTADWRNGFNADVTYEGEARYPDAPAGGYGRGPTKQGGQEYLPPTQGGGGGYQY